MTPARRSQRSPAPDHVHIGWDRVGGSRTDALDGWRPGSTSVGLDIVSVLERYDAATDQWKNVASGSTRVNKGRLTSSVTSGKFSTEVPTGELNLYRYTWRAWDIFQGGSYVAGALFPIYTTGK
ncbi:MULTISPECIES: hypothetical protein [Streptomyces]|uniref:hypothetical protein n=1 Tax=Streptomyces TaxID=1883 RepID=UPI00345BD82A